MGEFTHFAVWWSVLEGDTKLTIATALDWQTDEPEGKAAVYDLGRAIIAWNYDQRRSGKSPRVFVLDNQPRQWGEPGWSDASSSSTRSSF